MIINLHISRMVVDGEGRGDVAGEEEIATAISDHLHGLIVCGGLPAHFESNSARDGAGANIPDRQTGLGEIIGSSLYQGTDV